jgi:hypothetical protein
MPVLNAVPFAVGIDVGNYLMGLFARHEFHDFMTFRADNVVSRFDQTLDSTAREFRFCCHPDNFGVFVTQVERVSGVATSS